MERTLSLNKAENEKEVGNCVYAIGKPSLTQIQTLREQKRQIRASRQESVDLRQGVEYELSCLIAEKIPRGKKQERIQEIISKIKELQKKKNLTDFSRNFLNGILALYTKIENRKRQGIIKEILQFADKKERVVSKTYLEKNGIEVVRREHFEIKTFYSFL